MSRVLTGSLAVGILLGGAAACALWLRQPASAPEAPAAREQFARMTVGRPAPDFELNEIPTGRPIRLAQLRGKPTVLALGSFSCDLFCSQLKQLADMHSEFGGRANFLFVYIREAGHDNPALDAHLRSKPEATDRVAAGLELYMLGFPCVDGRNSETVREYEAWPERLYLLDAEGNVEWDSTPGFSGAGLRLDEAEEKLRTVLMTGQRL